MERHTVKAGAKILVGTGMQRLANLALVAFLVASVPGEVFTEFGLFQSALSLLPALLSLGLCFAPSRLFFDFDEEGIPVFLGTLFKVTLLVSLFLALVYFLVSQLLPLSIELFEDPFNAFVIFSCGVLACLFELTRSTLRAKGSVNAFVGMAVLRHTGVLIFIVLVSKWYQITITQIIVSYLAALFLAALLGLVRTRKTTLNLQWSNPILKSTLLFSLPLMSHQVLGWLVTHSGKWIATSRISLEDLAPYVLVLQFSGIVGMLVRALFDARLPVIGKEVKLGDFSTAKSLVNSTILYSGAFVVIAYLAAMFLLYVMDLSLPNSYQITPYLMLAAFAVSLLDLFSVRGFQLVILKKKTTVIAKSSLIAACIVILGSVISTFYFQSIIGLLVAHMAGLLWHSFYLPWKSGLTQ